MSEYIRKPETAWSPRTNVLSQHILDLFLRISSLHDQTLSTVDRTLGTQLGVQELQDVLRLSVHPSANVHQVGEHCLLGTFSGDLRGHYRVSSLLSGELGVVGVEEGEESLEQLTCQLGG